MGQLLSSDVYDFHRTFTYVVSQVGMLGTSGMFDIHSLEPLEQQRLYRPFNLPLRTIVLPAELSAAVVIASEFLGENPSHESLKILNYSLTAGLVCASPYIIFWKLNWWPAQLIGAVGINCMTRYGQYEYYFALGKVITIIALSMSVVWRSWFRLIFLGITGIAINRLNLDTTSLVPPVNVTYSATNTGITLNRTLTCITNTFGNYTNSTQTYIGFKYWDCPGAFVQFQGKNNSVYQSRVRCS